jgi:hypothetical protein
MAAIVQIHNLLNREPKKPDGEMDGGLTLPRVAFALAYAKYTPALCIEMVLFVVPALAQLGSQK